MKWPRVPLRSTLGYAQVAPSGRYYWYLYIKLYTIANKTLLSTRSLSLDWDNPSFKQSFSVNMGGLSIWEYCFNLDKTIFCLSKFLSRLISSNCIGWIYKQCCCSADSFRSSAKEESRILLVSSNGMMILVSKSIFIYLKSWFYKHRRSFCIFRINVN